MAQKLIYTSVPQGLYPQSLGFCTVARSRAMSVQTASMLENLSGYARVSPNDKPVVYSHVVVGSGAQTVRVLSRIQDYGLDYSNRTNHLAVHLVLPIRITPRGAESPQSDFISAGPAAVFNDKALVGYDPQTETRKWFENELIVKDQPQTNTPIGANWLSLSQLFGWSASQNDVLGWLGLLASTVNTGKTALIVTPDGVDALPLFQDVLAFVRPQERWSVTFTTLYSKLPNNAVCQWKTVRKGSNEEQTLRRFSNVVIDLEQINRPVEEVYKDLDAHSTTADGFKPGDCIEFARKRMSMTQWEKSLDKNLEALTSGVGDEQSSGGAKNQKAIGSASSPSYSKSSSESKPEVYDVVMDEVVDQSAKQRGAAIARKMGDVYGSQESETYDVQAPEDENTDDSNETNGLVDAPVKRSKITPKLIGWIITAVLGILVLILLATVTLPHVKTLNELTKSVSEPTSAIKNDATPAKPVESAPVTDDTAQNQENEEQTPEDVPSQGDTSEPTPNAQEGEGVSDSTASEGDQDASEETTAPEAEPETAPADQADADSTEAEAQPNEEEQQPELTPEELHTQMVEAINDFVEIANSRENALTFLPISKASEEQMNKEKEDKEKAGQDYYCTVNAQVTQDFTDALNRMYTACENARTKCRLKFQFHCNMFNSMDIVFLELVRDGQTVKGSIDLEMGEECNLLVSYKAEKFDVKLQMQEAKKLNQLILTSGISLSFDEKKLDRDKDEYVPMLKPIICEVEVTKDLEVVVIDVKYESYIDLLFDHKKKLSIQLENVDSKWRAENNVQPEMLSNVIDIDVSEVEDSNAESRTNNAVQLRLIHRFKDKPTRLTFKTIGGEKAFTDFLRQTPGATLSIAVPIPSEEEPTTILKLKLKAPQEKEKKNDTSPTR